ncbi:unnamed protein product [Ectocarpus sp. CCAP 1310/34]|nr:unnamed protein product [Ectocarpus sp. CCAP 1310/34]
MCASFAPPKPSAAFTVGKAGQDVAEPARRRTYSSNGRRNRSLSPLARELLNGGRNAFSSEDAVTPLSTAGSGAGYHFGSGEGTPTPLSISQSLKARGGYSITMPAALPMLSPTGDEGPASTGFSSTGASGGTTASAGGAATAGVSNATAAANTIPTFSEITRGVIDRNGAVPLEPFARARVRAVEEGWARWAADRREREKRRWIRVLSVVTFLVLVAVLVCRRIGVGISISGPTATLPPGAKPSRNGGPGEVVSVRDLFSAAVHEMPAIVSSRDELAAVLKLVGIKKAKPEQVGRAWSALVSGEARYVDVGGGGGGGGEGIWQRYVKGGALAAEVLVAGVLRNAAAVALLAVTFATVVAAAAVVSRGSPSRGQSRGGGFTCGTGQGGGAAANGGGSSSRVRGGNRLQALGGDGGCATSNGRANGRSGGGCAPRPGGDLRSPSPMSRRL